MFATVAWAILGSWHFAADGPPHRALHPSGRVFTPEQLQRALSAPPKDRQRAADPNAAAPSALVGQIAQFAKENPELAKSLLGLAAELAKDNPQLLNGRPEDLSKNIAEELRKRPDLIEEIKKLNLPDESRELLKGLNRAARKETPPAFPKTEETPSEAKPIAVPKWAKNFFPPSKRSNRGERDPEKSARPEERPHEKSALAPEKPGDLPRDRPTDESDGPSGRRTRPEKRTEFPTEFDRESPTDLPPPNQATVDPRGRSNGRAEAPPRDPEAAAKAWEEARRAARKAARKSGLDERGMRPENPNGERPSRRDGDPNDRNDLGGDRPGRTPSNEMGDLAQILQDFDPKRTTGDADRTARNSDKQGDPDAERPSNGPSSDAKPEESVAKLLGDLMRENPELVKSLAESAEKPNSAPRLADAFKSSPAVRDLVEAVKRELQEPNGARGSASPKKPAMEEAAAALKELAGHSEKSGLAKSMTEAAKDAANSLAKESERPAAQTPRSERSGLGADAAKPLDAGANASGGLLGRMASGAVNLGEWAARQSRTLSSAMPSAPEGARTFDPPALSELAAPSAASAASLASGLAAALGCAAALYFALRLLHRRGADGPTNTRAARIRLAKLSLTGLPPREQATRLFEHTALATLGEPARPKHHHAVATELLPEAPQHAESLADHYEAARYTPPDDEFSPERVEAMRRLLRA